MNRQTQVGVFSADAVQIAAGVVASAGLIHCAEGLGVIDKSARCGAAGRLKTIHQRDKGKLVRADEYQTGKQLLRKCGRWHVLPIDTSRGRGGGIIVSIAVHVRNHPHCNDSENQESQCNQTQGCEETLS